MVGGRFGSDGSDDGRGIACTTFSSDVDDVGGGLEGTGPEVRVLEVAGRVGGEGLEDEAFGEQGRLYEAGPGSSLAIKAERLEKAGVWATGGGAANPNGLVPGGWTPVCCHAPSSAVVAPDR